MTTRSAYLGVRLKPKTRERLARYAVAENRSESGWVEQVVEQELERRERGAACVELTEDESESLNVYRALGRRRPDVVAALFTLAALALASVAAGDSILEYARNVSGPLAGGEPPASTTPAVAPTRSHGRRRPARA